MNRNTRTLHATLDRQSAEAEARDVHTVEEEDSNLYRPDIARPRKWSRDIVSAPQEPKVLLLELTQRTSAKGTMYLAGWCQKARVVGFLAPEPNEHGEPVWRIYLQQPSPQTQRQK
jgi:hypothetical protein